MRSVKALAVAVLSLLSACSVASAAEQPKQGGILRMYHRDSPASASIHEDATFSVNVPFMPVFNNLVRLRPEHAAEQHGRHRARISPTAGPGAPTTRP